MHDVLVKLSFPIAGLMGIFMAGCASHGSSSGAITKAPFGHALDGTPVEIYTLRNANGVEARICTYGGILVSFKGPDRDGKMGDVVLGYDTLDGYLTNSPYFGALIGRYGNRIAKGKFTLDGVAYTLVTNNYPNALHGGTKGFDKVVWNAKVDGSSLVLSYLSKDGEEGYPGNLNVKVVYTLMPDNGLDVQYLATTDKDTVLNLTQHSYFNLAGHGDVLSHKVFIDADKFTPVDATLIPTGELKPVEGTPFDFRQPTAIGERIGQDDPQLKFGNGYDHNYVLNHPMGHLDLIARVTDPSSGRVLEVLSTSPGLQFYSGNFLDGTIVGKNGQTYQFRNAFAMEPQHFPDSPNQPNFPTVELKPGEVYHNEIIFRLTTDK
ncbi:MAG TPA: aldose epimerase family protein [Candidatus Saccharimonadales bacterium]|nr:aldose epimerase family protein [Candidatus Saccharimonadales bacterium]